MYRQADLDLSGFSLSQLWNTIRGAVQITPPSVRINPVQFGPAAPPPPPPSAEGMFGELPPWVIPAAAVGLVALFLMRRK